MIIYTKGLEVAHLHSFIYCVSVLELQWESLVMTDHMSDKIENIYYLAPHRKTLPNPDLQNLSKKFKKIIWHM